jgi:hypothetical protein
MNGPAKAALKMALLDAFRTIDELRQMVLFACDRRLDEFTSGSLDVRVFQLIEKQRAAKSPENPGTCVRAPRATSGAPVVNVPGA